MTAQPNLQPAKLPPLPIIDAPITVDTNAIVDELYPSLTALLRHEPNRRRFMQLMGASLGLAGLAGCRWPREEILPFADQPDGRVPGVPVQYATAMELAGGVLGLLVTSYDGRPIKIEGNPLHPSSGGKTGAWHQASVLDLYDPDRSQTPRTRVSKSQPAQPVAWPDAVQQLAERFSLHSEVEGAGLVVVASPSASPLERECQAQLLAKLPKSRWLEIEPLSRDNIREGARLAFGQPVEMQLQLSQAERIVSLDSDFLNHHPQAIQLIGQFADTRRGTNGRLSRLTVFESNFSLTGSNADERYPIPSGRIGAVAAALLLSVQHRLDSEATDTAGSQASPASSMSVAAELRVGELRVGELRVGELGTGELGTGELGTGELGALQTTVEQLARDLVAHRGRCVLLAGERQPPPVHAVVHRLNHLLGAFGTCVLATEAIEPDRPTHQAALEQFRELLRTDQIETLLLVDCNPLATLPDAGPLAEAIERVPTSIHFGRYVDETATHCTWHLPQAHYLESWSDLRATDGTYSLVQPLIAPLYDSWTRGELLQWVTTGQRVSAHSLTRQSFARVVGQTVEASEAAWRRTLHDGVLADSQTLQPHPVVLGEAVLKAAALDTAVQDTTGDAGFELNFVPDTKLLDGRLANNGWLQELPDPITKLTWDNAALLSPYDAARLKIGRPGDVLRLEHQGKQLEIPAIPLSGHARGCITVQLGYGRTSAGVVGLQVGTDVRPLLPHSGSRLVGVTATATGQHLPLAFSQDGPDMQSAIGDAEKRRRANDELIKVATLEQFEQHPDFAKSHVHEAPLWQAWSYDDGHKWGLSVDLSACIGCGGCVVACQAENNVPVVGKAEVGVGRIMHWLRVDRYLDPAPSFEASSAADGQSMGGESSDWSAAALADSPNAVRHQPLTCHQCESAPCEQVCPVAATVHDQDGLSVMVYSRCIGTRYCNNNCPFRVRRFNWFWNHHGPHHPRAGQALTAVEKMAANPNVTVRSRGVMEKCSFCSQRINAAKIQAKNEGRQRLSDGEVTPACAQACPAKAIVFGDLNDPQSQVRRLHDDQRAYELLPELNLKSRLLYLAKLTNPNPGSPTDEKQNAAFTARHKGHVAGADEHGAETHGAQHGAETHGVEPHGSEPPSAPEPAQGLEPMNPRE